MRKSSDASSHFDIRDAGSRELELLGEPTVDASVETPNPVFFFGISQLSNSGITEGFPATPKVTPKNAIHGVKK
jgi:hypothetical protein